MTTNAHRIRTTKWVNDNDDKTCISDNKCVTNNNDSKCVSDNDKDIFIRVRKKGL